MSGSGEANPDEDPGIANPEHNADADAPNTSDANTEPAMLEEEEMPTYMSLTASSRPEESTAELEFPCHTGDNSQEDDGNGNGAQSPYASDDQGGGSIYVVSSGEESNRAYDDEDYDLDEVEMEDEEEEDEDDDSHAGYNDDKEDDSEGDTEPEQFERSSDDFVLRYDTGLEKLQKARSRSLQDLTNSRGNLSRFVGKRRSVDIMGNYNTGLPRPDRECLRDPLGDVKKPTKSSRYADVPSKVKLYIQSIKEQNRRSMELKNSGNAILRNFNETKGPNAEVSCTRINPANKMVKGYVQNVMKVTMDAKHETVPDVTYGGRRLGENHSDRDHLATRESKQPSDKDKASEIPLISDNRTITANNIARVTKTNGIIDYSTQITQNHIDDVVEPMEVCTTNGQERMAAIFDLRTLSYEEYVNGDQSSTVKNENNEQPRPIVDEKTVPIEFDVKTEILTTTNIETIQDSSSTKTEVMKVSQSAPEVTQIITENSSKITSNNVDETNRENSDVTMLWSMLDQKSAQFNEKKAQYDGIRDAFQKTLAENITLKRELEELKKTLAQCKTDNKPRETKVVSVQTDDIPEIDETMITNDESKISNVETKLPIPKLLSSSIGSALSSIEQWSDSNCSPAISINPPNMDHILNSDDSLIIPERTPRRQNRQLSHAFVTSSRILQTLDSITQGRTKIASPLANPTGNVKSRVDNAQGQSKWKSDNVAGSSENLTNLTRLRKRKASDMLDLSVDPGCFKIPVTPEVPRKKINLDSDTDGINKCGINETTMGSVDEPIASGSKDAGNADGQSDDFEDTGAIDVPDNVKCFVYREESDSKERSFLIQADVSSNNGDANESNEVRATGKARECGPYLLGNVEIRMSEANGTINIWGKEVSQESDYVDVEGENDESDVDEEPALGRRVSQDGQSTPGSKFVNGSGPFVCSTNKKSKLSPQYVRSHIGKYFRPALSNLKRANDLARENEAAQHYVSSPVLNNRTNGCEQCDSLKKRQPQWASCDCSMNSRRKRIHSHCRQDTDANDRDCDCARGNINEDVIMEIVTNILARQKKCAADAHGHSMRHCCANRCSKDTCVNQMSHHRPSPEHDGDCHHAKKRCSSCADDLPSCSTRLTPGNTGCCETRNRSHSHASSCDDEDHPLLQNRHCDTPETKRRRSSGKKVRGILTDLLRGCGGCRDHSSASFVGKESTSMPNLNPTVRVTPCTPPQPACAKSSSNCASHSKHTTSRDPVNENCCGSCSRRVEMAAEIESKLELLTVEMERLRSRSDTFRGMLNLLNADTD